MHRNYNREAVAERPLPQEMLHVDPHFFCVEDNEVRGDAFN